MAKRKYKYVRLATGAPASKKRRTSRKQASAPSFALARTGGFLGKELKFIDYELAAHALVATVAGSECDPQSSVDCLNATAQGDTEQNRDGRRQFTHSIMIKGYVDFHPSKATATFSLDSCFVKLALVLDTQTNGAQLNAEDVFVDPSSTYLDSTLVRNLQYTSRFKVLKMITIKVPPMIGGYCGDGTTNLADGCRTHVPFSCYYNFKTPLVTSYTNTTAVVANIADNSLHLIAIKSKTTENAQVRQLNYYSRCRFTSG